MLSSNIKISTLAKMRDNCLAVALLSPSSLDSICIFSCRWRIVYEQKSHQTWKITLHLCRSLVSLALALCNVTIVWIQHKFGDLLSVCARKLMRLFVFVIGIDHDFITWQLQIELGLCCACCRVMNQLKICL